MIKERLGVELKTLFNQDEIEFITREDAKRLRTKLREEVEKKLKNKKAT